MYYPKEQHLLIEVLSVGELEAVLLPLPGKHKVSVLQIALGPTGDSVWAWDGVGAIVQGYLDVRHGELWFIPDWSTREEWTASA